MSDPMQDYLNYIDNVQNIDCPVLMLCYLSSNFEAEIIIKGSSFEPFYDHRDHLRFKFQAKILKWKSNGITHENVEKMVSFPLTFAKLIKLNFGIILPNKKNYKLKFKIDKKEFRTNHYSINILSCKEVKGW